MKRIILGITLSLLATFTHADAFDHGRWDALLKQHVVALRGGQVSQVDYAGMQRDRRELKAYLAQLSAIKRPDFDRWPRNERLSFLINAYNAWTLELVLGKYPDLVSIRDLGSLFQSPWKKAFIPLFGATRSLDEIEHALIRAGSDYHEPRIHFAVNCASIGCPALRPEAYVAGELDVQLEDATRKFLADRQRNRLRGNTLEVSSIFKWYREDFEKGWGGFFSLPGFLAHYASALGLTDAQAAALVRGGIDIDYLDYDWRLNRKP